jgi:microcystin-dependent protein
MPINTQKFSDFNLKSVPLSSDFLVGYDPSTGVELRSTVDSIVQAILPLIQLVPTGTIITHGASTPPAGYLECNGQQYNISTYENLYTAIGTTYGGSPGFFNVPDLRGYFVRGWDNGRNTDIIDGTYTQSAFTVTVDTNTPHGLAGGNSVALNFISGTGVNGTFTVVSTPTTTRFTYTAPGSQTTSGNVVLTGRSHRFGQQQNDGLGTHNHSVTDPGHTHAITDPGHTHGYNDSTSNSGANYVRNAPSATFDIVVRSVADTARTTGSRTTGITVASRTTGITVNSSGTASETRPKNIALLYCIKT